MISGAMTGSNKSMLDVSKGDAAMLGATKCDGATGSYPADSRTCEMEVVSDDELPSDHEDGELSEGLSDIFRSTINNFTKTFTTLCSFLNQIVHL